MSTLNSAPVDHDLPDEQRPLLGNRASEDDTEDTGDAVVTEREFSSAGLATTMSSVWVSTFL
jgi:hypothetical protein